jgi:Pentapeptide repeats (8 copies)
MRQPAGWLATLVIAAVLVLLACVLVFPRLLHPPLSASELQGVASADRRVELQQAQAKLQNDARATLLQGVAGLLLVAGAIATWRQVQISREGQITERFSRAIDHLGDARAEVRLGGIYTLERIAKDSPADRRTVEAVLVALVRTHAPWMAETHPSPTVDEQLPTLERRAVDVQTAMLILSRRPSSRDPLQLYLSGVDLRGAYLPEAQLSRILLRRANLARAGLPGAHLVEAALEHTDLRQADLDKADLQKAQLANANLCKAWLRDADLRGANLRGVNLQGANLHGARLEGADLTDACWDDTTVWPDGFQPR